MNIAELRTLIQSLPDDLEVTLLDNDFDWGLDSESFCITDLAYDRTDDNVHMLVLGIKQAGIQNELDCITITDYIDGKRPKRRPDR